MNEARAVATLSLFALGILAGVVVHAVIDKGPAENPYPALPKVDEPRAAHDVVAAIGADDAQSLSRLVDSTMLTDLDSALQEDEVREGQGQRGDEREDRQAQDEQNGRPDEQPPGRPF